MEKSVFGIVARWSGPKELISMSGAVEPRAEGVRGKISLVEDIHREEADL